ncbi:hypothetical protein AMEX_G15887 [Astyanax mexicanus]|uniref:Immunoglobulin V-set domain-containing protein n=1 Tax=Astyanax mexicanus TaxID=7994 RepID=A0A8T2LPZ6_ASTMX|nr:hypothetical protein AMEX_G15887 [Astyanax mexicanus]
MRAFIMFILMLLLAAADLSNSLKIPCKVQLESGVQYRKIIWYKVSSENSLSGLVMKDLLRNSSVLYRSVDPSLRVGEDLSLLLPEFRERRCETYRCSVWPPVGYRIQESDYSFPQGCQVPSERAPEFSNQVMDEGLGLESSDHVYIFVGVVVLLVCLAGVLLLLCRFALKYQQRPKYTLVPV